MDSSSVAGVPKAQEGETAPTSPGTFFEGADIKYVKGSKKIAGYKCKKAEMTFMGQSATIFYTDKLRPAAMPQGFGNLKGFPMEMQLNLLGAQITFVVKEVTKETIEEANFVKPEGYEEITLQEFLDKAKQMGGGQIGL